MNSFNVTNSWDLALLPMPSTWLPLYELEAGEQHQWYILHEETASDVPLSWNFLRLLTDKTVVRAPLRIALQCMPMHACIVE